MADVNWKKYTCDICRMIGLIAAAIAATLIVLLLSQTALPIWVLAIVFLIAWAVLFQIVEHFCTTKGLPSLGGTSDESAGAHPTASATAAEEALHEAAAAKPDEAEGATAEEAVATEEQSKAEQAAADQARADQAAAEEKAKAEQTASEEQARAAEAARAQAAGEEDHDGDGVVEGIYEGTRPEALDGPREGGADDLKRIKGVGPKLEQLCNSLGFYHFDQISGWTADEVAWVDANLEGFKGRVTRDEWVRQAGILASGGDTEFSKRVDDGDVPSSQ